jgi:DNA polymerase III epsilon subunit-like protein
MPAIIAVFAVAVLAVFVVLSFRRKPRRKREVGYQGQKPFVSTISIKTVRKLVGQGKNRVVVFDTETNGLTAAHSVLSLSAIKYEVKPVDCGLVEVARFDRYYHPKERLDPKAVAVNHLSSREIDTQRGSAGYPRHFCDDNDADSFFADADIVVAHNIRFDSCFVGCVADKKKFCTMKAATEIMSRNMAYQVKYPKLHEAAAFFEIACDKDALHRGMYDCEIAAQIFHRMLRLEPAGARQ